MPDSGKRWPFGSVSSLKVISIFADLPNAPLPVRQVTVPSPCVPFGITMTPLCITSNTVCIGTVCPSRNFLLLASESGVRMISVDAGSIRPGVATASVTAGAATATAGVAAVSTTAAGSAVAAGAAPSCA